MVAFLKNEEKRTPLLLVISLLALVLGFFDIGTINIFLGLTGEPTLTINLSWIAVLLCGITIVKSAVIELVTRFDIRADVLVSLALIASILTGEIFAAGEIAFIMSVGAWLEERTVRKARTGIEKLVHLTPATARVVLADEERIVPVEQVQTADTLRVFAGETIPVDGIIITGKTAVDQSVMTGEPLPVDKAEGEEVLSGTVNQFGTFDMKAVKVGQDSSLQRMIRLVESADAGKAKIVGLADRWATWIVVTALVAAIITWFVTGEIIRSVTVLVVFCPCALVLATPTAIMAGIGNGAKYGILISQGDALERLAGVKRIAFDKTGTLTYGKPTVAKVISCSEKYREEQLLVITARAELRSEHPLGRAIVDYYREQRQSIPEQPKEFILLPGRGVSAVIDGKKVLAGNEALLAEQGFKLPVQLAELTRKEKTAGHTLIYVMDESGPLGVISLADTLRPDAADTVKAIDNAGVQTILLTGDMEAAARHIAAQVKIRAVKANCLPEDKLNAIREFQSHDEAICMVGDGINDAPALSAAQVGIAMGGIGSDIAIEAADIILVGDDIKVIPHLLRLSKRVMRTINLNLTVSMALNFAAIAMAVSGLLNPVVGALVHNVGSVAVIINSALLLNWQEKKAKTIPGRSL